MEVRFVLSLPRDELTVPVGRHILRQAMKEIGVEAGCSGDIELALTEACANVLRHSGPADQYEVRVAIDERVCSIRVIDTGEGFDADAVVQRGPSSRTAENGRGIELMRAIVDRVVLISKPEEGTIVHLEKELVFADDAPMRLLRSSAR
jgi:serine/threonine-protein kinase RsbW